MKGTLTYSVPFFFYTELSPESEIPTHFFNIQAIMPNKPLPFLHPATKQPLKPEDLYPIFCKACADQELNQTDEWIPIPEPVREQYAAYRCTPLVRAYELEAALGTPAHIYFKNESVSPAGSHKLNSAIAQAYYAKEQGITNLTTETPPKPVPASGAVRSAMPPRSSALNALSIW